MCEGVCLCLCHLTKRKHGTGSDLHNFQIGSQAFSESFGHMLKDSSRLTFHANWQRRGVAGEVAYNKKKHHR